MTFRTRCIDTFKTTITTSPDAPLPSPTKVVSDTWELIINPFFNNGGTDVGLFWQIFASLQRVAVGFTLAAIPALALNLLADHAPQKNLTTQYSLPILPFLFLAVIATLAHNSNWLKKPKWIITWATIAFLALAKYGYFWSLYLNSLDTWSATQKALTQKFRKFLKP